MKRVKAGAIFQTILFAQKEEAGLTAQRALQLNREEFEKYKRTMDLSRVRYQISDVQEQEDGSILVHVRKQYNSKADVDEYFN